MASRRPTQHLGANPTPAPSNSRRQRARNLLAEKKPKRADASADPAGEMAKLRRREQYRKIRHHRGNIPRRRILETRRHTTNNNQHRNPAPAAPSLDQSFDALMESFIKQNDTNAAAVLKQMKEERDELARTHGELRRHIISSKEQRFDQQNDIVRNSGRFLNCGGLKKVAKVEVKIDGVSPSEFPEFRALSMMSKVPSLQEDIEQETFISTICTELDATRRCPFAKLNRHFSATKEELESILEPEAFEACHELFDYGNEKVQCNLMELAMDDLHHHIEKKETFDETDALSLFLGVIFPVVQLKIIHGLMHLDLKPWNYLVCDTGSDWVVYDVGGRCLLENTVGGVGVRLNDFDTAEYSHEALCPIAKNGESKCGKAKITTHLYSPPEMCFYGNGAANRGQDSFAIGKIMGHLFLNRPIDDVLPKCPDKLKSALYEVVTGDENYSTLSHEMTLVQKDTTYPKNYEYVFFDTVYSIAVLNGLPDVDENSELGRSKTFQTLRAFCTEDGKVTYDGHCKECNIHSGTNESIVLLRENLQKCQGGMDAFLGLIELDDSKRITAKRILFDSKLFDPLLCNPDEISQEGHLLRFTAETPSEDDD